MSTIPNNSMKETLVKTTTGNAAISEARKWIGRTPYVWGGNSLETGTDCSGFIVEVYKKVGVNLSENRTDLRNTPHGINVEVILSSAEPGDILTWSYSSGSHVSLYSGTVNGKPKMIHTLNAKYNTIETDATAVWVENGAYISAITRIKDAPNNRITIADGNYKIEHISKKCVDIYDASMSNGAITILWPFFNTNNQKFHVENRGNGYIIISPHHNFKVLEVSNSSLANGAYIQQWDYVSGYDNKQWFLIDDGNGYVNIINKHSGKAMSVKNGNTTDGTQIIQWDIDHTNAEKFKFIQI